MIMHLDMYFINEYMQYLKNSWLLLAEITIGLHCIVLSRHQYLHEGFLRVQLFRLQYGDQSNKLEHTCTTCKIAKRTCAFFTPSHIHIYTCQLLKVHLFLFFFALIYVQTLGHLVHKICSLSRLYQHRINISSLL